MQKTVKHALKETYLFEGTHYVPDENGGEVEIPQGLYNHINGIEADAPATGDAKGNTSTLEKELADAKGNTSTLEKELADAKGKIGTLEKELADAKGKIAAPTLAELEGLAKVSKEAAKTVFDFLNTRAEPKK
jgi:hypothetical protein